MTPLAYLQSRMVAGIALSACLQFATVSVLAAPVALERAEAVAANWMLDRTGGTHQALPQVYRSLDAVSSRQAPTYYHVINMDPGGWVIVSADDTTNPIIAYSQSGTLYSDEAPPAYVAWMSKVNNSIRAAAGASAGRTLMATGTSDGTAAMIANTWQHLENANFQPRIRTGNVLGSTVFTAVAPLLTTTWSQGQYYNQFCPADSAGPDAHALVGCCATAFGQILRYHSYPATGNGSHTYTHARYGTLSANFGATTYNWAAIPASGRLTTYNSAAATLLNHAGIALDMDYGPTGSGCYTSAIVPAFRNYFRYLTDNLASRSSYTDAAWIAKIKTDLDARRPIFYVGSGSAGGHAFILDGYNDSDYFHFNWGWNGAYDGYFLISNLNPAGYSFNSGQQAVFNIRPATATPSPTAPSALVATALSTQINLAWTDNSSNETGFRIERKTGASGTFAEIATPAANVTSFPNTGLTAGTTYYYRVRAYNASGTSGYSNEASATLPLPCSSSITTISVGGSLSGALATTDCRSSVRPSAYYFDNYLLNATAGVTYTITMNSTALNAYLYLLNSAGTVLASNDDGNGGTNAKIVYTATSTGTLTIHATSSAANATGAYTVTVTGSSPPTAPSSLNLQAVSSAQISLTWTDNSSNETGFRIERKTGASGTFAEIATSAANVISYANTGLTAGTTYYYRVRAYNASGTSGYSNEASATLPLPCSSSTATISVGGSSSGALATSDCRSAARSTSFYDNFTFAATAGATYTITMNSTAFNAYLYLLNSAGTVLASNDDGNGGTNAKVVYTSTSSGTLTIHATSNAANATGAYTVTLAAASPSPCASSRTAINSGSALSGTLATTDCRSTVRSGSYYDNFTFTATAGRAYTITMNSTALDAYLYLLNSAGTVLASNDDGNGGFNSKIVYTPRTTETLTIHATSYRAGAAGTYTVTRN